jgi:NADH-quinone oxidoreductase subunit M
VLTLSVLIIGGGLWPQPGVASRYHAATEIMARRQVTPTYSHQHQQELSQRDSPSSQLPQTNDL